MSKTYRDWSPDQAYLFPPSPRDWLPEDDLVYFLLDTIAPSTSRPSSPTTSASCAASRPSTRG